MKVLMDLERTVLTGVAHYWTSAKFGYTTNVKKAGRFPDETADQMVRDDTTGQTIAIDELVIKRILNIT